MLPSINAIAKVMECDDLVKKILTYANAEDRIRCMTVDRCFYRSATSSTAWAYIRRNARDPRDYNSHPPHPDSHGFFSQLRSIDGSCNEYDVALLLRRPDNISKPASTHLESIRWQTFSATDVDPLIQFFANGRYVINFALRVHFMRDQAMVPNVMAALAYARPDMLQSLSIMPATHSIMPYTTSLLADTVTWNQTFVDCLSKCTSLKCLHLGNVADHILPYIVQSLPDTIESLHLYCESCEPDDISLDDCELLCCPLVDIFCKLLPALTDLHLNDVPFRCDEGLATMWANMPALNKFAYSCTASMSSGFLRSIADNGQQLTSLCLYKGCNQFWFTEDLYSPRLAADEVVRIIRQCPNLRSCRIDVPFDRDDHPFMTPLTIAESLPLATLLQFECLSPGDDMKLQSLIVTRQPWQ